MQALQPETFTHPNHLPLFEQVAILIPCYNEERTIAQVIQDFQTHLPEATIYVFDNASSDKTATVARQAGAIVVHSPRQGKGNVVQHMFATIDANYYIMADGDATYPASEAKKLLNLLQHKSLDMVVGRRCTDRRLLKQAYRPFHRFGNRLVCKLIDKSFGSGIRDIFSGYRAFTRSFVKTIPLQAQGFEIELEMTLQALSKGYKIAETDVPYSTRPPGSVSKLNTYRDGLLVLTAFVCICRDYKPAASFGVLAMGFALASLLAGIFPIADYIQHHYVYHVPLAILATGFAILSALALSIGVILQTQLRYHNEIHSILRRSTKPIQKNELASPEA